MKRLLLPLLAALALPTAVNVFVSYLLMTKKHDKYSKRAKIGADIDRLFPNKKGMVLEQGNFAWTRMELDVAESKGLKIN